MKRQPLSLKDADFYITEKHGHDNEGICSVCRNNIILSFKGISITELSDNSVNILLDLYLKGLQDIINPMPMPMPMQVPKTATTKTATTKTATTKTATNKTAANININKTKEKIKNTAPSRSKKKIHQKGGLGEELDPYVQNKGDFLCIKKDMISGLYNSIRDIISNTT